MYVNPERMRLYMSECCFETKKLSLKSGITASTIRNALRGKNLRSTTVGRLAAALGVEPEYLLQTHNENDQQEAIKQAEQRDALIVRYTSLVRQLSEIPRGENWLPEFEDLEKLLKAEITEIRGKLGMDAR